MKIIIKPQTNIKRERNTVYDYRWTFTRILPIEEHIKLMDEAGVDKTNDFSGLQKEMSLLNEIIGGKTSAAIDARRIGLKQQKEALGLYQMRFIGFGSVPLTMQSGRELTE